MARPFRFKSRRGRGGHQTIRAVRGPGKFEGEDVLSLFAYDIILNGCDDDSWSDAGGSYSLINGPFPKETLKSAIESLRYHFDYVFLNRAERRFLAKQAGCICHETENGFVYVTWCEEWVELEQAWADIVSQYVPEQDDYEAP